MDERIYSILVVEDNPADTYIIQEAFRECGYRCQLKMAASQAEAQHLLCAGQFDLLLSDFGTDLSEGRAFVRYVRDRHPCLPIVIISGSYSSNPAYEAGANAFVHKPNDFEEFISKIRGIMQFWTDVAELPTLPLKANSAGRLN